jgi:tetratricopeptide (TPR) repeat protein
MQRAALFAVSALLLSTVLAAFVMPSMPPREAATSASTPRAVQRPELPADLDARGRRIATMVREADHAVGAKGDDAERWHRLGMAYHANDYIARAAVCYCRALEIDPAPARTWHLLALVYERLDRPVAATTALARVIQRDEGYAPAHWRLGGHRLDEGRLEEAEASFRAALRLSPDDPAARLGLARVMLKDGRAEDAVRTLEPLARASGSGRGYANLLLATALRHTGQDRAADDIAARGDATTPNWADPWRDELEAFRPKTPVRKKPAPARRPPEERIRRTIRRRSATP